MAENKKQVILLTAAHYFNQAEVLEFARHVSGLELPVGVEVHIAVADNSQNWEADDRPIDNFSVFSPAENLGYLNGCAFALRRWNEKERVDADWVAVVNTDLEFSSDFFVNLLSQSFSDRDGVIAPNIVLPSGKRQNPHRVRRLTKFRVLSYFWIFRSNLLGRMYLFAHSLRTEKTASTGIDTRAEAPKIIYSPHGSAMFFRRLYFDAGGRLDFGSFLYCEELHIAEQASRIDLNVVWMPGLTLRHDQHSTTGGLNVLRRLGWMRQSYRFILDAYYR